MIRHEVPTIPPGPGRWTATGSDRSERHDRTVRDHRNEILRTLLGGLGAPAALAVAGWPSGAVVVALVSLAGVIAGIAIAFLVERLLDREGELSTSRARVQELEDQADAFGRERELLKHRAAVAQMGVGD
jgi:hypothetical protein